MRTIRPSSSCVTGIWQDKREFCATPLAKSSLDCSPSSASPVYACHCGSTNTWQGAHAHEPPQSASMSVGDDAIRHFEAAFARKRGIGRDANAGKHQFRRQGFSITQYNAGDVIAPLNGRDP
jgi:hypothetical protein